MTYSSILLYLQYLTGDQRKRHLQRGYAAYLNLSPSNWKHCSPLLAENRRQTCLVANIKEVPKDWLGRASPDWKENLSHDMLTDDRLYATEMYV